jgi:D-sedoheptulose 7-phosphate isomerase
MEKSMDKSLSIITEYFAAGKEILAQISIDNVGRFAQAIGKVRSMGGVVFVAGNGGSAATASHFATDIGVGSLNRTNPVRVVSLCDNSAVITAISNDLDYSSVFEQQIKLLGKSEDLLVVISASGNSQNLIKAVEMAKAIGMNVFSLTGFDGGRLREITSAQNVHVATPKGAYGLVEDAHLAICHVITECIRSVK